MYLPGRGLVCPGEVVAWVANLSGVTYLPPTSSLLVLPRSPHIHKGEMETTCLLGQQRRQCAAIERPAGPSSAGTEGRSWLVAWLQLFTAALESALKRELLQPGSGYWGGRPQLLLPKPNGPAFAVSISLGCQQASRGTRWVVRWQPGS